MLAFFVLCSKAAFARGDGTFQTPLRIDVPHNKYTSLRVVDLDDDGVPDLIGVNSLDGMVLVALLDASGKARAQDSLPAGAQPMDILVGPIDGDGILDLAVPCAGSNYISIFFGRGGGAFATAKNIPTIDKPVDLALQDLDGDAQSDLAVISSTAIGIHFGGEAATSRRPWSCVRMPLEATPTWPPRT